MINKKANIIVLIIVLILLNSTYIYADNTIILDGDYTDWNDKPYYNDPLGNTSPLWHISTVRWYPDNNNKRLYLYCKRQEETIKVWTFTIHFITDNGPKISEIVYNSISGELTVTLYDGIQGTYLWGMSGMWTSNDKELEFYIPIDYLATSIESGYKIDMHFENYFDKVPDDGEISISTVSTFPLYTNIFMIAIVITLLIIEKRKYSICFY